MICLPLLRKDRNFQLKSELTYDLVHYQTPGINEMTLWTSLDVSISQIKIFSSADLNCWRKTSIFEKDYGQLGNFNVLNCFLGKDLKIQQFIILSIEKLIVALTFEVVCPGWLAVTSDHNVLACQLHISLLTSPPPPTPTSLSPRHLSTFQHFPAEIFYFSLFKLTNFSC